MLVLGIETTCDETAAAVIERASDGSGRILSNIVRSQTDEHARFGGVVPEIAARAHVDLLDGIVDSAMKEAGIGFAQLSAVAAAAGPGLIGGVIVGLTTAKAIAMVHDTPLIAVNHLEAHALTPRLTCALAFPYCLFLASGGHTQIVAVVGVGKYVRLGTTVDDAMGEAFDKVAKMLSLPYPGGPEVERAAAGGDPKRFAFPRPMLGRPDANFSLSGLKTAVRNEASRMMPLEPQDVSDLCASFQAAVLESTADRLSVGLRLFHEQFGPPRALVAAGGVAANHAIRGALQDVAAKAQTTLIIPPPALCTDNGAMIAWAGAERMALGLTDTMDAPPRARWLLDANADGTNGLCQHQGGILAMPSDNTVAVIGAGAWGTALAGVAARAGRDVILYARNAENAAQMKLAHANPRLPGMRLDQRIEITNRIAAAAGAHIILIATPAQNLREAALALAPHLKKATPVIATAKGIERGTHKFMTEVIAEAAPDATPAILSGPSFADDVARGLPTAVTLAAKDEALASALVQALGSSTFRPYHTTDIRGVEIGGAAKNVLAIAAGIVEGRKLGASALAALTTRGFSELARLGRACGARAETLAGLSGLGDLILSCSSLQSRNFALGIALGRGEQPARDKLAEGAFTAPVLIELAASQNVDMPVSNAVAAILAGKVTIDAAIEGLLTRPFKAEE